MSTHATAGELCTDTCHHVCLPCSLGYPEACDDLFTLPNGPTVACQAGDEPVSPADWDDVEHWDDRVHAGTEDAMSYMHVWAAEDDARQDTAADRKREAAHAESEREATS